MTAQDGKIVNNAQKAIEAKARAWQVSGGRYRV